MTPELEEYVATHLLPEKIAFAAFEAIRGLVADGWAVVDYQPGDGTSYKLVLTRLQIPDSNPRAKPEGHTWGCKQDGTFVFVGWLDHGCYPFGLLSQDSYFDPGYVASKFDNNMATGLALAALFNRIVEALKTERIVLEAYPDGFGTSPSYPKVWMREARAGDTAGIFVKARHRWEAIE